MTGNLRPGAMRLGDAVLHARGRRGTLGCFALRDGRAGFVSNAAVLAPTGARRGDRIHVFDPAGSAQPIAGHSIARLAVIDDLLAFAELNDGIFWEGGHAGSLRLTGLGKALPGEIVAKLGAASQLTTAVVDSALSNFRIMREGRTITVNDALLLATQGTAAWELGDGGAPVYTVAADREPRLVGLLAGTWTEAGQERALVVGIGEIEARLGVTCTLGSGP